MTDLEPDIHLGERMRRMTEDVSETIQTGRVLVLLLVYNPQPEVDLVGLLEFGFHPEDARESLFGMLKRSISIVQDTDSVPEFRVL
jgi:hypothetical protein